jgi:hypothetical protein
MPKKPTATSVAGKTSTTSQWPTKATDITTIIYIIILCLSWYKLATRSRNANTAHARVADMNKKAGDLEPVRDKVDQASQTLQEKMMSMAEQLKADAERSKAETEQLADLDLGPDWHLPVLDPQVAALRRRIDGPAVRLSSPMARQPRASPASKQTRALKIRPKSTLTMSRLFTVATTPGDPPTPTLSLSSIVAVDTKEASPVLSGSTSKPILTMSPLFTVATMPCKPAPSPKSMLTMSKLFAVATTPRELDTSPKAILTMSKIFTMAITPRGPPPPTLGFSSIVARDTATSISSSKSKLTMSKLIAVATQPRAVPPPILDLSSIAVLDTATTKAASPVLAFSTVMTQSISPTSSSMAVFGYSGEQSNEAEPIGRLDQDLVIDAMELKEGFTEDVNDSAHEGDKDGEGQGASWPEADELAPEDSSSDGEGEDLTEFKLAIQRALNDRLKRSPGFFDDRGPSVFEGERPRLLKSDDIEESEDSDPLGSRHSMSNFGTSPPNEISTSEDAPTESHSTSPPLATTPSRTFTPEDAPTGSSSPCVLPVTTPPDNAATKSPSPSPAATSPAKLEVNVPFTNSTISMVHCKVCSKHVPVDIWEYHERHFHDICPACEEIVRGFWSPVTHRFDFSEHDKVCPKKKQTDNVSSNSLATPSANALTTDAPRVTTQEATCRYCVKTVTVPIRPSPTGDVADFTAHDLICEVRKKMTQVHFYCTNCGMGVVDRQAFYALHMSTCMEQARMTGQMGMFDLFTGRHVKMDPDALTITAPDVPDLPTEPAAYTETSTPANTNFPGGLSDADPVAIQQGTLSASTLDNSTTAAVPAKPFDGDLV